MTSFFVMASLTSRYELRHGDKTIATGHHSQSEPLQVGDRIEIAGSPGIVRMVEPILGERELRVVVELLPPGGRTAL